MKLTNKANLPEPIVNAVMNDGYSNGGAGYSVTTLLKPPRVVALERKHAEEITEDVSDRIWSLLGQVVHGILERADKSGVAERRLSMEVGGVTVSGQMDRWVDGCLQDYKLTSVWKLVKGDLDEWEQQLNLYAVLLRHHGHVINKLEIVAILRDWSKRDAEKDPAYPQAQVVNVAINLWPAERAEAFLRQRVEMHEAATKELPLCSARDRWASDPVYAVMKEGRKTAVKLYATQAEADAHVGFDKSLKVVCRPGEDRRCRDYCRVNKFCSQYQESLASAGNDRPGDAA